VRTYVLGDRWQGDVSISGNSVRVVTNSSLGGHGVVSVTIDARGNRAALQAEAGRREL
jgi:hypothetical protein